MTTCPSCMITRLCTHSTNRRWTICSTCQPRIPQEAQYARRGCRKHHLADFDIATSTCRVCHRERQRVK